MIGKRLPTCSSILSDANQFYYSDNDKFDSGFHYFEDLNDIDQTFTLLSKLGPK